MFNCPLRLLLVGGSVHNYFMNRTPTKVNFKFKGHLKKKRENKLENRKLINISKHIQLILFFYVVTILFQTPLIS